jgi:hypothetical protein
VTPNQSINHFMCGSPISALSPWSQHHLDVLSERNEGWDQK